MFKSNSFQPISTRLFDFLAPLFIVSLSFGQIFRLIFPFLGQFYLSDFILVLLTFLWIFWLFRYRREILDLPIPFFFWLGCLFIIWSSITVLISWQNFQSAIFEQGVLYLFRYTLYFLIFPIFFSYGWWQRKHKKPIYWDFWLILSAVFLSIFGFVQLVFFPDFSQMAVLGGWDPHKNRLLSTFFDPNFTGAFLALNILIILPQLAGLKKGREKMFFVTALPVLFLALLLTFSRSAWALLALGFLVLGVLKQRRLLLIGLIISLAIYWLVPRVQTRLAGITDPADSAAYRLVSWSQTVKIWEKYPLFGAGFGNYRLASKEMGFFEAGDWGGRSGSGSDSSLLLVLATTGPLGLIIFLGQYLLLFSYVLFSFFKKGLGSLDFALLSMLAGLFVESFFINSLFYLPILAFFLIFVAKYFVSKKSA